MIISATLLAASVPIACVYDNLPADARRPNPLGLAPGPEQQLSAAEVEARDRVRSLCKTRLRWSDAQAAAALQYAEGRITGEFLAQRGAAAPLWTRTLSLVRAMSPGERAAQFADARARMATLGELVPSDPDVSVTSPAFILFGVRALTAGDMLASALEMTVAEDRFAG